MVQFNAHQVLTTAKFSDVAVTPRILLLLLLLQLVVYSKADGRHVVWVPRVISA